MFHSVVICLSIQSLVVKWNPRVLILYCFNHLVLVNNNTPAFKVPFTIGMNLFFSGLFQGIWKTDLNSMKHRLWKFSSLWAVYLLKLMHWSFYCCTCRSACFQKKRYLTIFFIIWNLQLLNGWRADKWRMLYLSKIRECASLSHNFFPRKNCDCICLVLVLVTNIESPLGKFFGDSSEDVLVGSRFMFSLASVMFFFLIF